MAIEKTEDLLEKTFIKAEEAGLKLAIKGRTVALFLFGFWLVGSRTDDIAFQFLILLLILTGLGLIHFFIIGSKWDRAWVKYLFISIDVTIISLLVATQPMMGSPEIPQVLMFRVGIIIYYFMIIAVAAFSFSPGLVIWSGIAGVIGWMSAFFYSIRDLSGQLSWNDIPEQPTVDQFYSIFLSPNFTGSEGRIQESIPLLIVAFLIAVVMWRARTTVRRQLEAEHQNSLISGIFGRFVPQAVADAMIEDSGALDPVEREATVLFTDIEGFTQLTESSGPSQIVEILNAYFDRATEIIGSYNGVITQFQGDAILATFNVPLEDDAHASNAVQAGQKLIALAAQESFAGESLNIRVGINTGQLIAGNVGGGGRQNYTVHGDAVNLAARLENLNKAHGTRILLSQSTVDQLDGISVEQVGEVEIRGLSDSVSIFTIR